MVSTTSQVDYIFFTHPCGFQGGVTRRYLRLPASHMTTWKSHDYHMTLNYMCISRGGGLP